MTSQNVPLFNDGWKNTDFEDSRWLHQPLSKTSGRRRTNHTVLTSSKTPENLEASLRSHLRRRGSIGLAPATESIRDAPTEVQI
jgi:hypothetical protein